MPWKVKEESKKALAERKKNEGDCTSASEQRKTE